jgi:hypothetical protein
MDSESGWVYERMKLYALMQEHPDWSQRQYARTLQHDPKWVRKWQHRLQQWLLLYYQPLLSLQIVLTEACQRLQV